MTLIRRDLPSQDTMHRAINAAGGLYIVPASADPREVRTEVLARGIRAIEILPGASIDWVQELPLEFLMVSHTDSVEAIGTLHRLRGLHLGSWVGRLEFEALPLLEWFDTTEPERDQLQPLLECASDRLHHLAVGRYPFANTTRLQCLKNLTHLALGDSRTLESLDGLGELPHLRHLSLYLCSGLRSLAGVGAAPGLQHFEIEACGGITELSPLADLAQLRSVKIEQRKPPGLAPFIAHPGMAYIWIVSSRHPPPQLVEQLLQLPRLRFLATGRSCWLRDHNGWEHVPDIYAMTHGQGMLHESLVGEYQSSAAW